MPFNVHLAVAFALFFACSAGQAKSMAEIQQCAESAASLAETLARENYSLMEKNATYVIQRAGPRDALEASIAGLLTGTRECIILGNYIQLAALQPDSETRKQASRIIQADIINTVDRLSRAIVTMENTLPSAETAKVTQLVLSARDKLIEVRSIFQFFAPK
jgi:hypothetical protein